MPYIDFQHVTKMFGSFKALDDVTLGIDEGCFMTLLGPSGCGKTTLMRQLAGFSEPDKGDIYLNGKRVNGLPPYKRGTPLVFQEYALFPHMTVYENISYGLRLQKLDKAEVDERVNKMLDTFNLQGMEKRFPRELSGGQQQRVAFGRALIMGQEVLLLDEPLSNLDAKLRVEVRSELRQIQKRLGITVIYVTHDQDEALSMSDKIAVMRAGRIEQVGTPWEVYFRPRTHFIADFVGTVNFLDVDVVAAEQNSLTLNWGGLRFNIPQTGFNVGDKAELAVRPECISLAPLNGQIPEGAHVGEITFYSFLGRYIRYWVSINGQTLIVDDANPSLSGAIEGKVQLSFDQDKLHLLKKEN
ncbi:ABC transporter ATP-binding protein [Eubacteriales bacterium OttesenSCG-928-K08]|nr:ABC transporter ATP-binding protein [Eubacteriales bacterium OttesenSCG-928-K08]